MPGPATTARKRARNTQQAESSQKRVKTPRLPLYKDHDRMCEQLGIPPRDKLATLVIRRELQDLCKEHGFELTRNYSSWGADAMRKLVKRVTAQLNADPTRKKVIPAAAVDALVHRLCLDNVRNIKTATEKKSKGDPEQEEDRNSKDEEDYDKSSDGDTPAPPTEPRYAPQQEVETDMDNEDGQDDKEFRHLNKSHTEIDDQLSNQVTDMPNDDLNGQTRLAEAHHHEIRLPPCRPVRAQCNDETRSMHNSRESRPCERNPAPEPLSAVKMHLPPVRAKYNDETRNTNSGLDRRSLELSPAPTPLSPVATVFEETVHLPLPHASECDILVHFGTESPSPLPVLIPRDKPFHKLYHSVTKRLPCDIDHIRLVAIVPEPTEIVYLDTVEDWLWLTARSEVVRLHLMIALIGASSMQGEIPGCEETAHLPLPHASECDTRTSIVVYFSTESPSPHPVIIPRDKPFHKLYHSVTKRLPCDIDHIRLVAIVPEPTEIVYLDTDQDWMRLTARREVFRFMLLLMPHTEN
ncbi:hypothetical protein FN846DRAFT_902335 [Sphaerosporella brunnea]|uniref:Uncharacterized protein n=1 Tax=Sphaerosporella brunnea TaxID=1250544 RepID=A0A5J5FA58_9PEZI|nr:hypothetical protein FN846DRAFT_902335 [Sphaerosporella brunnea]